MLTDAHHDWIKDIFGVDPRSFATPPDAPSDPSDPQVSAADSCAPGAAPADGGPAATPGKQFEATNSAAIKTLRTTSTRIVDPGPALDARNRMALALQNLDAAVKANDTAAAQAALTAAQAESAAVLAAPDPAMEPVKPGPHPDEVLHDATADEKKDGKSDIAMTDIHQEQIGDCYLLSSLGEIAKIDPSIINKMVKDNKDGTYTVTLHQHKTGLGYYWGKAFGSEFEDVQVTVDGNFAPGTANSGAGDDVVGGKREIWVQVVEKAYAKLHGGYDKIQGGNPANAMQELTGKEAVSVGTGSVSLADLQADIQAKKPVVMSTPGESKKDEMPFKMHKNHAYMVDKVVAGPDGNAMVYLLNPWGSSNPDPIPFDKLGTVISSVSVGGSL